MASSGDAALPNSLKLTGAVSSLSVARYCACYGWLLDPLQLPGKLTDGRINTTVHCCGLCHDTAIGVWHRRLFLMWQ